LATSISWPPADVGHISVEPAKSRLICIYDYLCNLATFISWKPVYVSHAEWNHEYCLYLSMLAIAVFQASQIQ
jgi:hypothetical protein